MFDLFNLGSLATTVRCTTQSKTQSGVSHGASMTLSASIYKKVKQNKDIQQKTYFSIIFCAGGGANCSSKLSLGISFHGVGFELSSEAENGLYCPAQGGNKRENAERVLYRYTGFF